MTFGNSEPTNLNSHQLYNIIINDLYKASVIISMYKNTAFLKVVLDSLKFQTERNFEIIISEDGRHEAVKKFVATYAFEHDYQHLTQEDLGWRKNKALNNAVRHTRSEWLIFIDGDCVLHPRFVEMHLRYAEENTILSGRRVLLDGSTSAYLLHNTPQSILKMPTILWKNLLFGKGAILYSEEGFFISPRGLLWFVHRMRSTNYLLGCNMSFSKKAIYAINGFDESFAFPAVGEDTDLLWRFLSAGFKLKSVRSVAVQYHLYHAQAWHDNTENKKKMQTKMERNEYFCRQGLIVEE